MDANSVLAYSYDDTGVLGRLATSVVLAAPGPGGSSDFDANNILVRCFDSATASIRVVFV